MPEHTNADLVKGVLLNDYDADINPDLAPAIASASLMVDDVQARGTQIGAPVSEDRLEVIERWLAAHFYAVSDRPYASRSTGGGSGSFDGKTDKGLDFTGYGQHAKLLDPTGYLASLGGAAGGGGEGVVRPKVGGFWAGRSNSWWGKA
jgi:hypothetical protein